MKIKIRQHDTSMPQEDGWFQTGDWLGEVRDDNHAMPPGDGHAEPDGTHLIPGRNPPQPYAGCGQCPRQADPRAGAWGAAVMRAGATTTRLETGPEELRDHS